MNIPVAPCRALRQSRHVVMVFKTGKRVMSIAAVSVVLVRTAQRAENMTAQVACADARCAPPRCGDAVIQANESCDDGNTVTETCEYGERACEVCNDRCQQVQGSPRYCGDGQPHDNEAR